MKALAILTTMLSALTVTPAFATPAPCGSKHGEAYIVCAETGGNPKYKAADAPHPGPSSAAGPYGLLAATRRRFGTAVRYMRARYGTWTAAEQFHRTHGWW